MHRQPAAERTTQRVRRSLSAVLVLGAGLAVATVQLAARASGAVQSSSAPSTPTSAPLQPKLAKFADSILARSGALEDLDPAAVSAGLSVRLMLPELACTSDGPSGPVVHIPVHITTRAGGRVSLFELATGETATVGSYVVEGRVYDRRVTRTTGAGVLNRGDRLLEKIVDSDGVMVQSLSYSVASIDRAAGTATFENIRAAGLETGDLVNDQLGYCWFCNMGSNWWCGFPCLPGDLGGPESDDIGSASSTRSPGEGATE
jgi:hypothetical protein